MAKYWQVILTGIQSNLVYRVNFFTRATLSLIPLLATIALWKSIFSNQEDGEVAGFSLDEMISYYLVVTLVEAFTAVAEDDWQIAADIREGTITQFILKPVDYLLYRLCLFGSGRLIYSAMALIPVGIFLFFHSENLVAPPDLAHWGMFALSILFTALLQFLMSYTMALLAFWVLEVSTFIFMLFAFEYLAGGHLFPLDILPPVVLNILKFTPFPYQLYFPVNVYLGKANEADLWWGFSMQVAWIGLFYLLARWIWSRGIRKYTAFGS